MGLRSLQNRGGLATWYATTVGCGIGATLISVALPLRRAALYEPVRGWIDAATAN
eukprot:SAG11_NODE_1508_length_4775_cov_1.760693_1_plen_54_part_10